MDKNVYQAPESDLQTTESASFELASRGSRLAASIIDSIIMMVVLIPIMYFTGYLTIAMKGEQPPALLMLMYAVLAIVIFALINGKLLISKGQTVGKKLMSIKITDNDLQVPTLPSYLKRYAVFFIPGQIPIAGQLFSIINILFIFSSSRKCLHDQAAKTIVVKQ